jgi:hypothetical protein
VQADYLNNSLFVVLKSITRPARNQLCCRSAETRAGPKCRAAMQSSVRPAFPRCPSPWPPGCESGVWSEVCGFEIMGRLRPQRDHAASRRSGGGGRGGCGHTATSTVDIPCRAVRYAHPLCSAACDRAGGCCAACNAGAGAGASRGRHHIDLVPPAALPVVCRKRKQPPAGTPVRAQTTGARCELYCEINRPPSLGAPSWRAKPDGSLCFGALG